MNVPLIDLKAQYLSIKEIDEAISRVLERGNFTMGEEVERWESEWAKFCGAKYCIGVSSGTDALYLVLEALSKIEDFTEYQDILTTPFTFFATTQAILWAELYPRFRDIEDHGNLADEDFSVPALPVHLYGRPGKWVGSQVIEDAAQAHGLPFNSQARAACHSFYPTKNLGAMGQAGAVVTNDKELADEIRLMRTYGERERFVHYRLTGNHRMDELQAAVLRVKLPYLDQWNQRRRQIAKLYTDYFCTTYITMPKAMVSGGDAYGPLSMKVIPPDDHPQHVYHIYAIRTKERDSLAAYLKSWGIQTAVRYPVPMHLQPALAFLGYKKGDFPIAEAWGRTNLSLPIYPEMADSMVEYVCQKVREWVEASHS